MTTKTKEHWLDTQAKRLRANQAKADKANAAYPSRQVRRKWQNKERKSDARQARRNAALMFVAAMRRALKGAAHG